MLSNVRAVCLCALAGLAASAALASTAAAEEGLLRAEKYPATVKGEQTNENVLSNGIRSVSCSEASLEGSLGASSKTISITPAYSNCKGNGSVTATIATNGCTYTMEVATRTSPTTANGQLYVDCPAGQRIQIDIWATGVPHSASKLCRLEVPAQGPITSAQLHNISSLSAKKRVALEVSSSNLTVLRTQGTAVNCGAAEKTNASFNGKSEWTAEDGEGKALDLFVASPILNPEEFSADEYPATIMGAQVTENVWSNGVRSFSCAAASLVGVLNEAAGTIEIDPTYANCSGNGGSTLTITPNGCDYEFDVTQELSSTEGTASWTIDCPEGNRIFIDTWAAGKSHSESKLCRVEIPPQGPLGGIVYRNVLTPSGKEGIDFELAVTGLKMLRTEGTAFSCGAAEANGTYNGKVRWTATSGGGTQVNLTVG